MKKLLVLMAAFGLCVTSWVFAEVAQPKEDSAAARKQQVEQAAREELASKEWTIQVTPKVARRGESAETDVLTFTTTTVKSANLSVKGYSDSNYALNIESDGTVVWETMQGIANGDTALLRGELKNDVLRGSISMQSARGDRTVYMFASGMAQPAPVTVGTKVKQGK